MRTRDERTATETSGADVLSSSKKLRKTLGGGGGWHPPPPLYVWGLIDLAKAKSEASAYILNVKATNCNIIHCQPPAGNVQILLYFRSILFTFWGRGCVMKKKAFPKKLSQQATSLMLKLRKFIMYQDRSKQQVWKRILPIYISEPSFTSLCQVIGYPLNEM